MARKEGDGGVKIRKERGGGQRQRTEHMKVGFYLAVGGRRTRHLIGSKL